MENKKLPQYGRTGAPVSLAVLVFAVILSDIGYQVNVKKGEFRKSAANHMEFFA